MSRRRRRPRSLVLVAVIVAVLGALVVVPYAYVTWIAGDAPEELAAATASLAPATGSVAGTWTVGAGSRAGYRVQEVLAGQDTTAVGRTEQVTGSLTASDTEVTAGSVTVDLASVRSDSDRRDGQFRGRIMDTARFPTATFTLTEPFALGPLAQGAGTTTVRATGTLDLHGVTRPVTAGLTAVRSGAGVQVSGQVPVTFADHGIDNPSIGGFVTTRDEGVIELLLQLTR